MKFYFYSELNACLKINGEYTGSVSKNVSATNLSEKDDFLFEFLPNNCEFLPCYGKAGSGKMQPEPACAPLQTGDFCGAALCGDAGRKDPACGRAFLRGAGRIPAKKVRGMKDVRAGRMLRTAGSFWRALRSPRFIRGML